MATQPPERRPHLLPQINPFISYLLDAFVFLNDSLEHAEADPGRAFAFARASTMHTLAALHAAANASLHAEDQSWEPTATLAEKFDRYLQIMTREVLADADIAILHELELVSRIVNNPQVAQAHPVAHAEKSNLIEFDRTPLKKISHQAAHWIPAYAGCSLGLACAFLSRFYRLQCAFDTDRLEILFGIHACSPDSYTTAFDQGALTSLAAARCRLLANQAFMRRLSSPRWLMHPSDFALTLFDGCPGYA